MKFVKIPKRNGGSSKNNFRIICVPSKTEKITLRELLYNSLNDKQLKYCDQDIVFGFMPCKNICGNALKHVGFRFTWHLDLADFFDSVRPDHVKKYLTEEEIKLCFPDGVHSFQGLPTSPCAANLASIGFVKEIKELLATYRNNIVFTAYADDLNFSCNFYWDVEFLRAHIPAIIEKHGFKINEKKTRLLDSLYGRREICGIYASYFNIHTSRKFKRTLRAAIHNGRSEKVVDGMIEHLRLKLPVNVLPEQQIKNLYNTYSLLFNKAKIKNHNNPDVAVNGKLAQALQRAEDYLKHPNRKRKEYAKNAIKIELAHNGANKTKPMKNLFVYKQIYKNKLSLESLSSAWLRKENNNVSPFEEALNKVTNLSRNSNAQT